MVLLTNDGLIVYWWPLPTHDEWWSLTNLVSYDWLMCFIITSSFDELSWTGLNSRLINWWNTNFTSTQRVSTSTQQGDREICRRDFDSGVSCQNSFKMIQKVSWFTNLAFIFTLYYDLCKGWEQNVWGKLTLLFACIRESCLTITASKLTCIIFLCWFEFLRSWGFNFHCRRQLMMLVATDFAS